MSKIVDNNSFWLIKHNPISKVGVFPYMGRSISDDCEPDKIYYVYRPAETLKESVPTWDNPPKPFIDDHEMLGEGFSKIDERPVQGVISNPVFENDVLYADISVYSESLKDKIAGGKKELSLGYFCKYRKEKGVYKGEAYDYVQEDMVGNHIALVDNGRCGSDVKVFDSKCTMDSLDLIGELKANPESSIIKTTDETTERKESEMADKREYIRKIMAIAAKPDDDFEGGEKEKIETIAKLLENSEYSKSEDEEEKEEKKAEDKCGKDEDTEEEEKATRDCSKKGAKDEDDKDEDKKAEDEDLSAADVMSFLKLILDEVRALNGKKTTDEDEEKKEDKAEDEDEDEKKSEDEDDEEKESKDEDEEKEDKKAEDSAIVMTFARDGRDTVKSFIDDPALRAYLGLN